MASPPQPPPRPRGGREARYLIHFKHRYLGFRHADLQAAALAAGCAAAAAAAGEPPPPGLSDDEADLLPPRPGPDAPLALARADPADPAATPFWRTDFPSEDAAAETAGRATLVKCVLDLWGEGDSLESLAADLASRRAGDAAAALGPVAWRAAVDAWGCALPGGGRAVPALLARLPCLASMRGAVRLSRPDVELRLIIVAPGGRLPGGVAEVAGSAGPPPTPPASSPAALPAARPRLYFGRALGHAAVDARRAALSALALASRPFAGPTAMDPEVGAVMAVLGLVRKGCLAFDPFAGSGSVLVSAAAAGAHVFGGELDAFALAGRPAARAAAEAARARRAAKLAARRGGGGGGQPPPPPPPPTPSPPPPPPPPAASASTSRNARRRAAGAAHRAAAYEQGKGGSAAAAQDARAGGWGAAENFAHYSLPRPAGLLLADAAAPPFRAVPGGWLDAVLADPPYGVRAGGRKVGGGGGGGGGGAGGPGRGSDDEGGGPDPAAPARPAGTAPRGPARAAARFRAGGSAIPTSPYPLGDMVWDLLRFAAAALVDGGRLVYFLPARAGPLPDPSLLPSHPALRLVAAPAQPLTSWYCRRLVVMARVPRGGGGRAAEVAVEAAHAAAGRNDAAFAAADAVAAGVYGGFAAEDGDCGASSQGGGSTGGRGMPRGRGKTV